MEISLNDADFVMTPECTTDPTSNTGEGKGCQSDTMELEAPHGFVFNYHELKKFDENGQNTNGWNWLGQNGKNNDIQLIPSECVEIIPDTGILLPRHISVHVTAQSHGGLDHIGERAWSKARIWGKYVKIQGVP